MFIYFDRNGVLQEVINDKAARLGDLNANEIYVYVDEVELDDIWLTLKRPDGTLSVEKSFIANKVVREIPYDPKRDMKFFKDFKEYEFYKFTISDEITIAGVYQATIRMTYEDTLSALGVLVFKAETGVIKSDQNITQAQYDYLIWYVGSWQGQIGDLEDAMGIAQADILGLKNRMNVAEQDINKIEDGTTVVNKALKDDLGNTIKSTYANKLDLVYSSSNNRIAITLKSYDGASIDADLIDLPKATTSADGLLAKEDKVKINNIAGDIAAMGATKQNLSEKNQINGYAGLDNNAKIPSSLLPDSVLGQLEYKGTFTPTAYPLSPEKGWFYISIGNGTIGGVDFQVGDWAVYNGSSWDKVDNTDAVMSVNGKLGVVVLNGTDIKVGNGDAFTIEQRIVSMIADINNTEQRLTDLLGMANLQDILIGSYTNGQTVSASDLSAYNFVIALGKDLENTYTGTFKPSEIVSGNIVSLSPTVYLTRGATDFTITTPTTVKLWGIKLSGITTDDIEHNGDNLKDFLDDLQISQTNQDIRLNEIEISFENVYEKISNKIGLTTTEIDLINYGGLSEIALALKGNTYTNELGVNNIPRVIQYTANRVIPKNTNSFDVTTGSGLTPKMFNVIEGHKYFILCHWEIVNFESWQPLLSNSSWLGTLYKQGLTQHYGGVRTYYSVGENLTADYWYSSNIPNASGEATIMYAFNYFPLGSKILDMTVIDTTAYGLDHLTDAQLFAIFSEYFSNQKTTEVSIINKKTGETNVVLDNLILTSDYTKKIYLPTYIDGKIDILETFGKIQKASNDDDLTKSYLYYVKPQEKPYSPYDDFIGKNIAFLGDSITQGNGMGIPAPDYQKLRFSYLICNELGANELNYGFSGTSIGENATITNTAFVNRFTSISQYSDIIFVLGGTNDYHLLTALGDMNSSTKDTFYGALKIMASGLLGTKHIGARVIFATPPKRNEGGVANAIGVFFEQYVKAIRDVANFYGIELLDLYNILPFDRTTDKGLYLMNDNVHPNPNGNIYMKNIIIKQLVYGI